MLKIFNIKFSSRAAAGMEISCNFANVFICKNMDSTINYQELSAVDALWTLYRQQSRKVRDAFRVRIEHEAVTDIPCVQSREEMMDVSRQRMKNIINGSEQTLDNDEVMRMVDDVISQNL